MLTGQYRIVTVDLGHEYVLHNLVRVGSVSLPPFVTNRETVREVDGTDACRCEARLFKNLPCGSLKKSFFLSRARRLRPARTLPAA